LIYKDYVNDLPDVQCCTLSDTEHNDIRCDTADSHLKIAAF
jgi:hypothetical protein